MNDINVEVDHLSVIAREELINKAKMLGIKHHHALGTDKLRELINTSMEESPAPMAVKETVGKLSSKYKLIKHKEARKLVRMLITCMNPNMKEHKGAIFTVSNSFIGDVSKYVEFDEPWHVPVVIYKHIKARKLQVFKTVKGKNGQDTKVGKLINEYAVTLLDPLTAEELQELALEQSAAHSID